GQRRVPIKRVACGRAVRAARRLHPSSSTYLGRSRAPWRKRTTLDVAFDRPADDQVVRKLARSPGSNALGACRAELARAASERILEQEADSITDRVKQPLGRLGRVRADVEVGLREVLLGDRAPDRASAHAQAFTVPSAASS